MTDMGKRKPWIVAAALAVAVAVAGAIAWRNESRRLERVTRLDVVVRAEPAVPGEALPVPLAGLRLRVAEFKRGLSPESQQRWTHLYVRVEGPDGPLACPPPVAFGLGNVSRLVLGSGATRPATMLLVGPLDGKTRVHCGPAEGETHLRELVLDFSVRPGAEWDTTRFTLEKGAVVERAFPTFNVWFGPSPIDPDRQIDVTTTLRTPGGLDAYLEARDQERPLLGGLGMVANEAGMRLSDHLWADPRRDAKIAFPVAISIHQRRAPAAGSVERTVRFVVRDLPLE